MVTYAQKNMRNKNEEEWLLNAGKDPELFLQKCT